MTQEDLMLPNSLMLQALVSIQEVMGEKGLNAVLRASGLSKYIQNFPPNDLNPSISFSDYALLNQAIEDFYGRGGRGILRRIGRASFQFGVREQAALLGIAGAALKLLPKRQRVKFILNSIGSALKKTMPNTEFTLEEDGHKIAYMTPHCSICYGRHSTKPVCHLFVGSLDEAVRWATGDTLPVRETHCIAKGDPYCRYEVEV
jgi:bacteriochlorophyll 4-vinyl reductase